MKKAQLENKLQSISNMIDEYLAPEPPMLVSTLELLNALKTVVTGIEAEPVTEPVTAPSSGRVIISCDASVKKNPGGPASVGVVIQPIDKKAEPLKFSQLSKATTNNQAEYDAVYFGLMTQMNLSNNPGTVIEIRSDSLLVIDQLKGIKACNDKNLDHKRAIIVELIQKSPVPVELVWRPRNSTPELKEANFLAQDLLDVPRH